MRLRTKKCLRILKNFQRQAMGDEQEGSAIMSKCLRILKSFKRQALGDERVMPALVWENGRVPLGGRDDANARTGGIVAGGALRNYFVSR